jgi:zinc protease
VRRWLGCLVAAGTLALTACGGARVEPIPPRMYPVTAPPAAPVSSVPQPDRSKLPAPGPEPHWAPPTPEVWTLSNGIKVYFLKQGKTPLVSMLMLVPHGSATDPNGKAGLTAMTADMLDEGAAGKSALDISAAWQRLATDYGEDVDVDYVTLYLNTIAKSFAPSVRLLGDIVLHPDFHAKDFARRKAQRLADALSDESRPGFARGVVIRQVLYGGGYAGEKPGGTRETLKRIYLGDVRAQYKRMFAPDGVAFVVVGGIKPGPVKSALEATFGQWQGHSEVKSAQVAKLHAKPGIYLVDFPGASQSALAVTTRADGESSPDYFPDMIFNRAFGGAFDSRLNLNLREDKGYTYGASSVFERWKNAGLFALAANVKTSTTRPSLDQMFDEVKAVCGGRPITEKEREQSVEGLLLGFPGRFQSVDAVVGQFADIPAYGRSADWWTKWPSRVYAVTTAEANTVAKKYCDPSRYVVVIAGDDETIAPTFKGLDLPISYYDAEGHRLNGPPKHAKPHHAVAAAHRHPHH